MPCMARLQPGESPGAWFVEPKGKCVVVRRGVRRKPEADVGLDEQKSDIRPMQQGNVAMDTDARQSSRCCSGKSGEYQQKAVHLTLGGLIFCSHDADYPFSDRRGWQMRSQQRS